MGQLVICKACGFIMLEEKLGDVCPACGVLKKMFEPHNDRVSEKRRKVLEMHIHPIMVHFSQAFAFSVFLLAIGMLFFQVDWEAWYCPAWSLYPTAYPSWRSPRS